MIVPDGEASRQADFEKTSEQLNEGLKTCRTVFEHYRDILAGNHPDDGLPGEPESEVEAPSA